MKKMLCVLLLMLLGVAWAGSVKVASLHPLLSDMARRVGGEHVEVVDLFPPNAQLHAFEPSHAALAAAAGCRLALACGKGVEPYLADLREAFGPQVLVLELGASVPDVEVPGGGVVDPHWWNAPENMKRASLALADALSAQAPEHAEAFAAAQGEYARAMDRLTREARLQLARVPRAARVLVTAHAAMCHFCKAFRLEPVAAQGVAKESEGDMAHLAQLLAKLRQSRVRCLFAEVQDSPKIIETLAQELGAEVRPLAMDGVAPDLLDYESLFLFNLRSICAGLAPEPPASTTTP